MNLQQTGFTLKIFFSLFNAYPPVLYKFSQNKKPDSGTTDHQRVQEGRRPEEQVTRERHPKQMESQYLCGFHIYTVSSVPFQSPKSSAHTYSWRIHRLGFFVDQNNNKKKNGQVIPLP